MQPGWGHAMREDPDALKGKRVDSATLRRVWTFARPYRRKLSLYLTVIVALAIVGVLPPLVFKELVDQASSNGGDLSTVDVLGGIAVALALSSGAINLVNRWLGSWIGDSLLYDLLAGLFDLVQR